MFLYANGCSLTWGDELATIILSDKGKNYDKNRWDKIAATRPPGCDEYQSTSVLISDNEEYRLAHSWPGQLSKLLDCEDFENDGFPGGSNKRILRTTLDWILYNKERHKDLFVVIGWTYHNRIEIWDQPTKSYKQYNLNLNKNMDKDEAKFIEGYWQRTYNEYERLSNFFQEVIILQSFLKSYEIDYLFFNAIQDFKDIKRNMDLFVFKHLIKEIDQKRYFMLEAGNFLNWALEENKYPHGPGYHPLEKGHAEWAKVLYKYINENNLV